MLAKELATIDLLSEGRLEIGIGAGWMISDYQRSGIRLDNPGGRIDRLVEGLNVIKSILSGERFSYADEYYDINEYAGHPRPLQVPCPPILIGGGGRRVLEIAAREADIVGINGTLGMGVIGSAAMSTMTASAVDEKVAIAKSAAGDRWLAIELNIRPIVTTVTAGHPQALSSTAHAMGVDVSMLENSPFVLIGTQAQIIDDLQLQRERWGFSYIIIGAEAVESFAPIVAELTGQ